MEILHHMKCFWLIIQQCAWRFEASSTRRCGLLFTQRTPGSCSWNTGEFPAKLKAKKTKRLWCQIGAEIYVPPAAHWFSSPPNTSPSPPKNTLRNFFRTGLRKSVTLSRSSGPSRDEKSFAVAWRWVFEILLIHLDWAWVDLWLELQGIQKPLMCSVNGCTLKTSQSCVSVSSGPNTDLEVFPKSPVLI